MPYLALYDIAGIQKYIYNTNRLVEIMAGSRIVQSSLNQYLRMAVEGWAKEGESGSRKVEIGMDREVQFVNPDSAISVELIYSAGGNALVYFQTKEIYRDINCRLSQLFIEKLPGVLFYVCAVKTNAGEAVNLRETMQALFEKMGAEKAEHSVFPYRTCFSITKQCESTGQPAERLWEGEAVSAERFVKIETGERLGKDDEYAQLEDLAQGERGSMMAIVHIDGNDMGDKLMQVLDSRPVSGTEYGAELLKLRVFSRTVTEIFEASYSRMQQGLERFLAAIWDQNLCCYREKPAPLRKIYIGGDDVTFIVNGYLALKASELFLQALQEEGIVRMQAFRSWLREHGRKENAGEIPITACAGIAFCKPKYPFYRAYQTALESCESAKRCAKSPEGRIQYQGMQEWVPGNFLDFHIIHSNLIERVQVVRDRYNSGEMKLFARPWLVCTGQMREVANAVYRKRDMQMFWDILSILSSKGMPRSKVKELRNACLDSPEKVAQVIREIRSREASRNCLERIVEIAEKNYGVAAMDTDTFVFKREDSGSGAEDRINLLFDALEYFDLYIVPKGEQKDGEDLDDTAVQ